MLKAYDLVCPKCGFKTNDLLEYDIDTTTITEEVLCKECGTLMEVDYGWRPAHSKHVSWSQWAIGHGSK